MNGFLVTCNATMDDIPVRLFATEKEAVAFVKRGGPTVKRIAIQAEACGRDVTSINGWDIWKIEDGCVVSHVCCWDFGDPGDRVNRHGMVQTVPVPPINWSN